MAALLADAVWLVLATTNAAAHMEAAVMPGCRHARLPVDAMAGAVVVSSRGGVVVALEGSLKQLRVFWSFHMTFSHLPRCKRVV